MSKSFTLCFDFHGVVGVKLQADSEFARDFFLSEYQNHAVDRLPDDNYPLVVMNFSLRSFPLLNMPQGYSSYIHKGLAHWCYRLIIAEDRVNIDVIGNHFAVPMVHHMLLHASLRYLAARHSTLLLHAGAVSYQEKSLLFTGRGGTGKTTTTSLVFANGDSNWRLHADDYTFLASGPKSYCYQTRSHLYRDLLNWVPQLKHRLGLSERARIAVLGQIRGWSKNNLLWPVRIPFSRLWPDRVLQIQATPTAILFLRRSAKADIRATPIYAGQVEIDELLDMNFWEARHFLTLIKKNDSLTQAQIDEWRVRERNLIERSLLEIPSYMLELPYASVNTGINKGEFLNVLLNLLSPR